MDARQILDGLLNSAGGSQTGQRQPGQEGASRLGGGLFPADTDERANMLKGAGAGALAAGAVALLFGNKRTKKFSGKALKLGGTAALGGLAYKVFTDWQAQQRQAGETRPTDTGTPNRGVVADDAVGTPIDELPGGEAETRSEAIVQAMIMAARADGHVDDRERQRITERIEALDLQRDVTEFLFAELGRPVDAARVAGLADSPEAAAEIYLASAMVIENDTPEERRYLDALARALELDPQVATRLELALQT